MSTEPASLTTEFTASTGFVGRRQELVALRSALEEALSGQGRLVMLAGEPGIGKTRTAQELATYAQPRGAQVLWGRCYEGEGAPPYWPWIQLLKSFLEHASPDDLRADLGPGAPDLGELLPELRGKLAGLESPPALEPEQARFRLFNSVTIFLKNAAQRTPLVLVLDDLHWADRSSLLLLEFLSQQLGDSRLLVLGTYRDVEVNPQRPLSGTLAQLSPEPVFRRHALGGLSLEDSGQFIEFTAGVRPTPQLIAAVYARTEGNPFFTAEVVRLLSERGGLQDPVGPEGMASSMPVAVLEVIGRRLNRLTSQCNQTLTTAAMIGREFDFQQLSLLGTGTSEEQLLEVIDEALEAHLIEELPEGRERYQFRHALIQETLTQQLSSSRKVRLHARIAQALEELYGVNAEAHAAELAYHFGEAQTLLGAEKFIKYSSIAGERALAFRAYDEALGYFERAVVAKAIPVEGSKQAIDAESADLLFRLGRAQAATSERQQLSQSVKNLLRALNYYAEAGDVDSVVAVADSYIWPAAARFTDLAKLTGRALEFVPPDSHEAGRLLARHGLYGWWSYPDYDAAQEVLGRALDIARRERDIALEMRILVAAGHIDSFHLQYQDCLEKDMRAIELAAQVSELEEEAHARYEVASVLHHLGDLHGARRHARALLDVAERSRDRIRRSQAFQTNAIVSFLAGDLPAARDFCDSGLQVSPTAPVLLGYRGLIAYTAGDFEEGKIYLEKLMDRLMRYGDSSGYRSATLLVLLIARITEIAYWIEFIEDAIQKVTLSPSDHPATSLEWRTGFALLSVYRGDVTTSQEYYYALEKRKSTMLGGATDSAITADRLLGLLSHTMGNLDQASTHFEDAQMFCRKAGYLPELAWSCYDYAQTLLQRGHLGDELKAATMLDEAQVIATEIGMLPLVSLAVALQERFKAQPILSLVYPDGLTPREVEILRLVGAGKSNPEIAKALYISPRTVSTHVSHILNKINAANRTEAASYANRHGLV